MAGGPRVAEIDTKTHIHPRAVAAALWVEADTAGAEAL
jgi:hypothetical protein